MTDAQIQARKLVAVRLRIAAKDLIDAASAVEVQADDKVAEYMNNATRQLEHAGDEYEAIQITSPVGEV